MFKKKISILLAIVLCFSALTACSQKDTTQNIVSNLSSDSGESTSQQNKHYPLTLSIYDDKGNQMEQTIEKEPQRIVVIGQGFAEWMIGLGEEKRIVGLAYLDKSFSEYEDQIKIVADALERVDLTEYANRSYLTLSGGEKQRVILARAIAQEPKFLVLDEPTNHLDIKYQIQILTVVKSLNIGVLAALHDLPMAAVYCDMLYVIKDGKIIASGSPKEVLTKKLIRQVYEIDCEIYTNPITGNLAIAYLPLYS